MPSERQPGSSENWRAPFQPAVSNMYFSQSLMERYDRTEKLEKRLSLTELKCKACFIVLQDVNSTRHPVPSLSHRGFELESSIRGSTGDNFHANQTIFRIFRRGIAAITSDSNISTSKLNSPIEKKKGGKSREGSFRINSITLRSKVLLTRKRVYFTRCSTGFKHT